MYALFVTAVVVGFFTVFQLVTIAAGVPVIMVVTGESMLPALQPYDVIILESAEQINIGDIAVVDYRDKNNLFSNYDFIVHRVTKIWEQDGIQHMQTKGDNVKIPEYAAKTERITAKVTNSVPILGVFIWPPVNFLIIAAALIILLYSRGIDQQK